MHKKLDDRIILDLMFEATMQQATVIKDTDIKHEYKYWFNKFFKEGCMLSKQVWDAYKQFEGAEECRETLGEYLFEVINLALNANNYDDVIEKLKEMQHE